LDPNHGGAIAQTTLSPITPVITPSLFNFFPGAHILVTFRIDVPNFQYEEFIIQARRVGSTVPEGSWKDQYGAATVGCRNPQADFSGNDTVVHQPFSSRNVQSLNYIAPLTSGTYVIELTVVEKFGVFWKTRSRQINVSNRFE
jgi:Reeler domain